MDLAAFRAEVVAWLDAHDDELHPRYAGVGTLDEQMAHYRSVKRALWDADIGRHGWPESVGGLGTPPILRAVVNEEVAMRELTDPGAWSMIEVLAPSVIAFGTDELIAEMVPPLLRGDELWCQGFSEPDAGSDLASLSCRARRTDGGWLVTGQKVWTSFIQYAERCVLLTRTGEPGSAHRGITALFVDVDSPGLEYRPIETQHGRAEFAEVFYDDVFVPDERVLGEVNGGWQLAMDVLPYERSTTFWARGAHLLRRCEQLVEIAGSPVDDTTAHALGATYQATVAFRARSRATQHRLASGGALGAETSIDKILIAGAEQLLFDTAREILGTAIEFGTDDEADVWRTDYLYSRAATIYGGTAEVQRNIVARRLLDLGREA